ncbi:gamma-glutamylcyclotransferase [Stappia sp. ES.058]|uniref:gamma-glutamylcyclotransferase n=1 Tax=Stappia sp. ES.058 TaxID=1881061 RepID=UPI000879E04F|nr:gamma-glutamylcyclotransferase [Stappia sp. ES.058]SDU03258.1 cation transport protein ChaC [Stappia sp. ES.058]
MPNGDLWVFGYGSLMWRPGFRHDDVRRARVHGYRRALCLLCCEHRGTRDKPGLVFGLEKGGSCVGLAYRIPDEIRARAIAYLRARELAGGAYSERVVSARLCDGTEIRALCYTANPTHERYVPKMSAPAAARIVTHARGQAGANIDYMLNTLRHLQGLGIDDPWLCDVARLVSAPRHRSPISTAPRAR